MTIEEWDQYSKDIQFEFARDNPFAEIKDQQIISARAQTVQLLAPFIGTYYSHKWIRRNILKQTDFWQSIYQKVQANNWWLLSAEGKNVNVWPSTWMINAAANAPKTNGQNWSDYLPELVTNKFLKNDKYTRYKKESWSNSSNIGSGIGTYQYCPILMCF